ncbi:hypothetical protein JYP46_21210 [Nitratireductor aquimarinus]|uniref:hypothetical protein n=1 Tax=Alphaproteobacteria TaxID=28211 RepID=UPI0019D3FAB4|nr:MULTISPECIES: hypothetical protein [Alphaproteobacteria]MBN7759348.1 hypothetical protein [Nitratireductor aquimarinus]MBY6002141.1 hypothetical protein [Tritonibacter mobilis]MBY6024598.1 hypothetical protein [Nitratireductor sp. DP7N14-4]
MDDFSAARSRTIPPLPWSSFPPPFSTAEATIKAGHVREEFVALGAKKDKSPEEITRHEALKSEMAQRLLPLPADEIYYVHVLADTQA